VPGQPLGQHFLASSRIAARLVDGVALGARERVVEIGAGTGVLTAELASRAALVLAVELDPALAHALQQRFVTQSHVVVLRGDGLDLPLPAAPFRVVANPPFAITSSLLRALLDDPTVPMARADLVVQWQVARARVHATDLLAARWAPWWEFTRGRRIPASWFRPKPRVDAALLTITRRAQPLLPTAAAEAYGAFVRAEFARNGDRARSRAVTAWADRYSLSTR
jgi:23S rRNA (adenine-N6)-dimethyltransferase